jgi:hypothetical protein
MVNRVSGRRLAIEAGQDRNTRRCGRERPPRPRLPDSSDDPQPPAGGAQFTKFRLFALCLFGEGVVGRMALS